MNKTVIVTLYKRIELLPPVMSLLLSLKSLGMRVVFLGIFSESAKRFLEENMIENVLLPDWTTKIYKGTFVSRITSRPYRLWAFLRHRRLMRCALSKFATTADNVVVWHAEIASAALLGDWCNKFKNRLLTHYELSDFRGAGWYGFSLKRCLKHVHLVVPEYNRAHIIKEYFKLNYLPSVIPNIPYYHPRKKRLPLPSVEAKELFAKIGDAPIILYQGVWSADRTDVAMVIETIVRERPDYHVVCLPGSKVIAELENIYSNIHSLPFVPAPQHLAITSYADIGVAIYNTSGKDLLTRLNAVYCAPNKIYEYAGFGIPVLCSNLPGLSYTVERNGAGMCCDITKESILRTIDKLVLERKKFEGNANAFFECACLNECVLSALSMAMGV